MSKIIAELKIPKQRMTRPFGFILRYNEDGTYSVHRKYYDKTGGLDRGHYQLDFENGMRVFREECESLFSYSFSVYEIADTECTKHDSSGEYIADDYEAAKSEQIDIYRNEH